MNEYEFSSQEATEFARMLLEAAKKLDVLQQNDPSPYRKVVAEPGQLQVRIETSAQTFEEIV